MNTELLNGVVVVNGEVATEKLKSLPNGNSACNVEGMPYCANALWVNHHKQVNTKKRSLFIMRIPYKREGDGLIFRTDRIPNNIILSLPTV
jgi:hypothetical protein